MRKIYPLFLLAILIQGSLMAQEGETRFLLMENGETQNNLFNRSGLRSGGELLFEDDFDTAQSNPNTWLMYSEGIAGIPTPAQGAFEIIDEDAFANLPDPAGPAPALNGLISPLTPVGVDNGFAMFNGAQFLTSTPASVDSQNAVIELDTTIDLTGYPYVILEFQDVYRRFNSDEIFLEVSNDNGASWASFALHREYQGNATSTEAVNRFNLSQEIGGSNQVRIRFRWENFSTDDSFGSGYGWLIDNVKLINAFDEDLVISLGKSGSGELPYYFYVSPNGDTLYIEDTYTQIPQTQIQALNFNIEEVNEGKFNQDSWVEVSVTGPENFNFNSDTVNLANGDTAYRYISTSILPTTLGSYQVDFTANGLGSEENAANNTVSQNFELTQGIYARDNNIIDLASFGNHNSPTGYMEIGNIFHIANDDNARAVEVGLLGRDQTTEGISLWARIYEITYIVGTVTDLDETNLVAFVQTSQNNSEQEHVVSAADLNENSSGPATTVLLELTETPLLAGKDYLVVVGYAGTADFNVLAGGNTTSLMGRYSFDGASWFATSEAPMVRLHTSDSPAAVLLGVEEKSETSFNLAQNAPNPFSDETKIAFELRQSAEVSFEIIDLIGKIVYQEDLGRRAEGKHEINVRADGLPAGTYQYNLKVGEQLISKKMTVVK